MSTLVISLGVIGGAIAAVTTMVVRGMPQPATDLRKRHRAPRPPKARPVTVAPPPEPAAAAIAVAVDPLAELLAAPLVVVEPEPIAEPEPVAFEPEPEPVAAEPVSAEPEPELVAAELASEPEPVAVEPEPQPEPEPERVALLTAVPYMTPVVLPEVVAPAPPSRASVPAPSPFSRGLPVRDPVREAADRTTWGRRLRSVIALSWLVFVLGIMAALAVGGVVLGIALVIRRAIG